MVPTSPKSDRAGRTGSKTPSTASSLTKYAACDEHRFGSKSIGYLAGCALLVNNITGPGVPQLPNMFVEAGWLLPSICILSVWVMTTLSASMYCEAMRHIPGNEHFRGRAEYTVVVKHYFGGRWVAAARWGLNGSLQSLNIISVVLSAQVVDNAISAVFGQSCAINFTPFENVLTLRSGETRFVPGSTDFLSCVDTTALDGGSAWGCHIVLTAGFVIAAALALPCGRWNLDDNMSIQTIAFALTIGCWLIWIVASLSVEDLTPLPAVNTNPDTGTQAAVLGTILFNFGFVTTVPSWVNEKKPHVSVNKSLWVSTTLCIGVFFLVGISGALAFPDVLQGLVTNTCAEQVKHGDFNCANDLLQVFTQRKLMPAAFRDHAILDGVLRLSVYAFPIVAVVSSIPVFSIVVKYNMIEAGSSTKMATFLGVVMPWILAFPLLKMPNALGQLVNFTSLFFVAFTDFIVPLLLYVCLHRGGGSAVSPPSSGSSIPELETTPTPPAQQGPMDDPCHDDLNPDTHVHDAFPSHHCDVPPEVRVGCALVIVCVLTVAALAATMLSLVQGSWTFDARARGKLKA